MVPSPINLPQPSQPQPSVMTISISRAEILPSSTTVLIQSQSRDTCIRYNPVTSYEFAPRISFKPLLWIFLMMLIAFSVMAIIMGDAINYPLVRREVKKLRNNTLIDVLVETNDTDDVLYRDEYSRDELMIPSYEALNDTNSTESDDRNNSSLKESSATVGIIVADATNFSSVYELDDGKQANNSDVEGAGYTDTINSATKPNSTVGVLEIVTNTIESSVNKTITAILGQQHPQNIIAESHLSTSISNNETTTSTSNSSGESAIIESNDPITPSENLDQSVVNTTAILSRKSNETRYVMSEQEQLR